MDFTKHPPVILSLCPGMRGLERGFDRACERLGWLSHKTAAYVEIESFIIWNLVKQMEQGVLAPAPIHSNIKTFDGKPFRGKIHGIFGGYPCQPFSLAGQRKGTEDPRHLWPYISGIIKSTQPVFCFFENVSGHLSMGYDEVYRSLREMGYRVEAGLFTAEEIGAPHKRERLFILAVANSYDGPFKHQSRRYEKDGKRKGLSERDNFQKFNESGDELGHSSSEGFKESRSTGIRELQKEGGEGVYNRPKQPSIELANTSRPGLQERESNERIKEFETASRSGLELADSDIWRKKQWNNAGLGRVRQSDAFPARPGQEQFVWESLRTIESRVGFTINGYNFREDLLRMAGNGVVEQTAELAFIDLLNKHYGA